MAAGIRARGHTTAEVHGGPARLGRRRGTSAVPSTRRPRLGSRPAPQKHGRPSRLRARPTTRGQAMPRSGRLLGSTGRLRRLFLAWPPPAECRATVASGRAVPIRPPPCQSVDVKSLRMLCRTLTRLAEGVPTNGSSSASRWSGTPWVPPILSFSHPLRLPATRMREPMRGVDAFWARSSRSL